MAQQQVNAVKYDRGLSSPPGPLTPSERNAEFLARATNGYTSTAHSLLDFVGRRAWLNAQLNPTQVEPPRLQQLLAATPSVSMNATDFYAAYRFQSRIAALELGQATVSRAVHSTWQLRERMVEFWHDHFNVHQPNTDTSRLAHQGHDKDVIRRHVFGRFEDMLLTSAKSAAMLNYLDGGENVVGAPNENYAREVMELHTLGVDGPYTEQDVVDLARCLTGWSFEPFTNAASAPGAFVFNGTDHDFSSKAILGLQFPAGVGVTEGEVVLRYLASHPKTIDFVCRKLVHRFVSEFVPHFALQIVKRAWVQSQGDLREVTRALFSDDVANIAKPWQNRKVKRPFQLAVGLVRGLDGTTTDTFTTLLTRLATLGQRPFYWAAPNGYPDRSSAWAGDLYGRWRLGTNYAEDAIDGLPLSDAVISRILASAPTASLADKLNQILTGGRMRVEDVASVQSWLNAQVSVGTLECRDAIGMLVSAPDYQLA